MALEQEKIPIWLDCDTGHDDAFALLLAAHHPRAALLGVSTTHGNAPVHHTTANTRAVLTALGRPDIIVIPGADSPLSRDPSFAPTIHGESGLDGVHLLPRPLPSAITDSTNDEPLAARTARIAALILAQPPARVYIVATGPLTNIATLLTAHPAIAAHIAGISLMGGAVGGSFTDAPMGIVADDPTATPRFGNWTPVAEFNIYADPEAARVVFHTGLHAKHNTMVTLDLSHLCRGVASVQGMILRRQLLSNLQEAGDEAARRGPPLMLREMMHQVMTYFAATYASLFGIRDGPPVHDPLAVWAVLEPERFGSEDGKRHGIDVMIERTGYDREKDPSNRTGQTVLLDTRDSKGTWRVPKEVDLAAFWETIDEALTKAEAEMQKSGQNPWADTLT